MYLVQQGYSILCNSSIQIVCALLELLLETSALPVVVKESEHYKYFSTPPSKSKPQTIRPYVDSSYFEFLEKASFYPLGNVDVHISAAHWLESNLIITNEVTVNVSNLLQRLILFARAIITGDTSMKYALAKFQNLFK